MRRGTVLRVQCAATELRVRGYTQQEQADLLDDISGKDSFFTLIFIAVYCWVC